MSNRASDAPLPGRPFLDHRFEEVPTLSSSPPHKQKREGPTSPEQLIEAALSGDEESYEQLFIRYRKQVLEICYLQCGGYPAYIHDICQETFISAFRQLGTLRDPSKFFSWLAEIARSKCMNFHRREKSRRKTLNEYTIVKKTILSSQNSWTDAEVTLIQELIQSIDRSEIRDTIRFFYLEGKKTKEIAGLQGISQSAVTTRLNRFRLRLRKQMARALLNHEDSEI